MATANMPAAEVEIDAQLVGRLIADQHKDLAGRALTLLTSGWDNVIYRLGQRLVVRLPRRLASATLVEHEQRWLPALAPWLPMPTSAPVRVGRPGHGYPWAWSICAWLPGQPAAVSPPSDLEAAAATLGRFVAALHRPAPPDAPTNPVRGGPLAERDDVVRERVRTLADDIDGPQVLARWQESLDAPTWRGLPRWLHGDLHPGNVLTHRGPLSAVIDFGDLTAGDPATDLAVAWMMFPAEVRPVFRAAAGSTLAAVDDDTWTRARGWALNFAVAVLANSADNLVLARVGRTTLDAVLDDKG